MQELRLVGVHDDGESVVLASTDGSRYRLRVDEALRAAVRRDRARLGQLQIQTGSPLRPRDIQARIRAGDSAEEVAAAGGLPVEHVRRYEGPVLAERAHMAGLARRTSPGRAHAGSTLDDVVVARLLARAVDPEGARWDSWREDDGWIVQVEFVAGGRGRLARWGFDAAARVLTPLDDEARWLSDDEPVEPGPLPGRRHLGLAPDADSAQSGPTGEHERVYDVEADGGVRSVGGRSERPGRPGRRLDPQAAASADLLDVLDAQRGVRPSAQTPEGDPAEVARVDALLADPPPAHPADSDTGAPEDRTILPEPAPVEQEDAEPIVEPADTEEEPVVEVPEIPAPETPSESPVQTPVQTPVETPKQQANRRRPKPTTNPRRSGAAKRNSVPSWDEIMFGSKKD